MHPNLIRNNAPIFVSDFTNFENDWFSYSTDSGLRISSLDSTIEVNSVSDNLLQINKSDTNVYAYIVSKKIIKYDDTKTYLIKIRARNTTSPSINPISVGIIGHMSIPTYDLISTISEINNYGRTVKFDTNNESFDFVTKTIFDYPYNLYHYYEPKNFNGIIFDELVVDIRLNSYNIIGKPQFISPYIHCMSDCIIDYVIIEEVSTDSFIKGIYDSFPVNTGEGHIEFNVMGMFPLQVAWGYTPDISIGGIATVAFPSGFSFNNKCMGVMIGRCATTSPNADSGDFLTSQNLTLSGFDAWNNGIASSNSGYAKGFYIAIGY